MAQQYDVTSVGVNPAQDRARRMRMYFLAMTLRVLCILSLIWVRGWWILLAGLGAVLLPYFAVLIANAVSHAPGAAPGAPTPLELEGTGAGAGPTSDAQSDEEPRVIVVDAPAERRSTSGDDA